MTEHILDYPEDFDQPFEAGAEVVAVKWFFLEAEARLYAARLREAGIRCFVSNANTTTMLPFGGGGIGLHIQINDSEAAQSIIHTLDHNSQQERVSESYHDYDKEDIAYLKEVETEHLRKTNPLIVLLILSIIVVLIYAIIHNYRYY